MDFSALKSNFKGEVFTDNIHRIIYATDASAYREMPLAVCVPMDNEDIRAVICFAHDNGLSIIPRASGTSIAGQVVGNGIVVDVSKNFGKVLELNEEGKWIRIQPCVVLDELNKYLAPHNLFFGPETSTSNRCMISGMVGNNSCGSHSLIYGSTRDHLLEVNAYCQMVRMLLLENYRARNSMQNANFSRLRATYTAISAVCFRKRRWLMK